MRRSHNNCNQNVEIAIKTFKDFKVAGPYSSLMFFQPRQITVYKEKARNTTRLLFSFSRVPCQTAKLASALRKPQVIFHLSMCGIFHALIIAAAPFIVCAGSTNDDLLINLDHDVTNLAPVPQQIDGERK